MKLALDSQGRPRILAWDVVDFAEHCEDLQSLARVPLLQRAVAQFTRRHRLRSKVIVSLRGEAAFNRTVNIPAVNDESLERMLEYEAQQQIPYPLSEVHWDRRVLAIQDDGAIRATIYALRRDLVEERVRRLSRLGMPVDGLQLRPLALHNFCMAERLLSEGTVVVDCDYGSLQVLIHHDDHTWFRVLPVGGVDHVERLRRDGAMDHAKAVAVASGKARASGNLAAGCATAVAKDLAEAVGRVVAYYGAARPSLRPSNVLVFHAHPTVPELGDALGRTLGLPVVVPKGFREIQVHADVVSAGIQEHFPEMVRAVGLALQGLGRADVDVRLHGADLERPVAKTGFGFLAAAVVLVLLFSWITYDRTRTRQRLGDEVTSLVESLSAASPRAEIQSRSAVAGDLTAIEQLGLGARARLGPARLFEQVLAAVDEGPSAGTRVAHFRTGLALGGRDDQAILVLARQEIDGPADADREIARFVDDLRSRTLGAPYSIREAVLEASWSAPGLSTNPPTQPSLRLHRWMLRHHRYSLHLGDAP